MFSMVLFSLTLAPTNGQETPFSLKTSFCGSMTTSAVSCLVIFIVRLLAVAVVIRIATLRLLFAHVLAEERAHQPGDLVAIRLQGEVAGVEQVVLQRLQVALVRLGPGGWKDLVVLSPGDQHRWLMLAEILLPLRIQRRVVAVAEE